MGILLIKNRPQLFNGYLPFAALTVNGRKQLGLLEGIGDDLAVGFFAAALGLVALGDIAPVVVDVAVDIGLLVRVKGKVIFVKLLLDGEVFAAEPVGPGDDPVQRVLALDLLVIKRSGGVDALGAEAFVVGGDGHADVHAGGHFISAVRGAVGPGGVGAAGGERGGKGQRRGSRSELFHMFQVCHPFYGTRRGIKACIYSIIHDFTAFVQ